MISRTLLRKLKFKKVESDAWKGETWYRDDIEMFVHYDPRDGYPLGSKGTLIDLIELVIESVHGLYPY
jgi:hypothetical protein